VIVCTSRGADITKRSDWPTPSCSDATAATSAARRSATSRAEVQQLLKAAAVLRVAGGVFYAITNYGSADARRILRRQSSEIESVLGYTYGDHVVHRNDLVCITREVSAHHAPNLHAV